MIFDILKPLTNDESNATDFVIYRPAFGYRIDMWELDQLFESCGFNNHFICNAGGYENAIALFLN